MNRYPNRHVFVHGAIAAYKRGDGDRGAYSAVEVLLLVQIADHLAKIVGAVANLGEFPVDYDELVRLGCRCP